MTNRTLQFYGKGYGATPVGITATIDGSTVFSGEIPTVNESIGTIASAGQVLLFTTELPITEIGQKSMIVEVTGGQVVLTQILTNYPLIPNPVFSAEQFAVITAHTPRSPRDTGLAIEIAVANPPLSDDELAILRTLGDSRQDAILTAHNIQPLIVSESSDPMVFLSHCFRSSVTINGVEVEIPDPRPLGADSEWSWIVNNGDIMACTINILG